MNSKSIKKFTDFNYFDIEVEFSQENIKIFKNIPSKIEIIEKIGFGDDRERRVVEWDKIIILDIIIPIDKQEEVIEINKKLNDNYCISSLEYYELKGKLILSDLEIFSWDELW
jgi:hypothetical protein